MDVKSALILVALAIGFIGCSKEQEVESNSTFTKPDVESDCESQRIPNQYFVRWKSGSYSIETAENDEDFVGVFLKNHKEEVLMAEPHFRIALSPKKQRPENGFGGDLNWGVRSISAPDVWEKGIFGEGIIVAVIDSGVDMEHPELAGTFAKNPEEIENGLDDDGNGLIDDIYGYDFVSESPYVVDRTGHGTHVTGIVSAHHEEGSINGVAPQAKILPLSFIDESGLGSINAAIRSINYAASRGAQIINASWGGNGCSKALKLEIEDLKSKNVLFISAAGNSGQNLSRSPEYPAAFDLDNLLTVGASTVDHYTAGFSNYGSLVDLVAPGAYILSTFPKAYDEPDADGQVDGIQALDGTSMSTPFVAGAAALLWSAKPDASYHEILEALLQTVDSGNYPVLSRGQINVSRALDSIRPPEVPRPDRE